MKLSNEIKVGIVVVIAIAVGVFFFAKTGNFKHAMYDVKTTFIYAGDLEPDAIVKLSGVEVGRLKDIKFTYGVDGTKVECLMEIDARARLREDSIAYVGTTGFLGAAYIGITPGTSAEFLKPGSTLASEDPIQTRELMKRVDSIAGNLDSITTELKGVMADNRQNLDNIILNLEATTKNFEEFSADVKKNPWKLLFKQSGK